MINLKKIIESRNAKAAALRALAEKAVSEERALTEEETASFDEMEAEVRALDETIERAKRDVPDMEHVEPAAAGGAGGADEAETRAISEFASFIRSEIGGEKRADVNLAKGGNGTIIPKHIASMIIKQVRDRAPLYEMATKFNVKGTLVIPYYDEEASAITVGWHEEFTELESTSGKFASVELTGYLAGALSKVSESLLNNTDFDLVSFVVSDIAEKVAEFIESEIISGDKLGGLSGVKIKVEAASATAVKADEIIDLKDSVKDRYQSNACWVMSPATRTALRKLKDANGRYLLNDDLNSPFGSVLLGKPVHASDAMPDMAAGKPAIYYGDFSGLAVNVIEQPEIKVLREKFATQHAVGIITWIEFDCEVMDAQKIACLTMKGEAGVSGE